MTNELGNLFWDFLQNLIVSGFISDKIQEHFHRTTILREDIGMGKKMWQKKVSRVFGLAATLAFLAAAPVMAEEMPGADMPKNQWVDMDKGPGVAYWVDENGVKADVPGVKPQEVPAETGEPDNSLETEPEMSQNESTQSIGENKQPEETTQENVQEQENEPLSQESVPETGQENQQSEELTVPEETGNTQSSKRVIDPNRPMVALTFDDGPFAPVGNQIMDCLAQYGGKATFYVVGDRCPSYRAEMQRMAAEGHEIGNHTYEHKYLHKLSAAEIQYQISKGSQIIHEVSGVAPTTVRLPGGNKNATVLANVNGPIIMWSIDTLDWKTRNPQSTVDKVLGNVKDGDVVLMHELYKQTGDAAVQIIPKLVERGYQLVTVSEMAKYRGGLESGKVYSSFRP